MTFETPVWVEATGGDAPILFSARQYRTLIDELYSGEGVAGLTDLVVTQRAAGANMSVDVSAGLVIITGDAVAAQGKYASRSTAIANLTIATAPGSGTRTDLVVAQLYDKQADGGTQYAWTALVITGSTTPPPSSIVLGQVVVPTGTASITTASNINAIGRQYATLRQTGAYRPSVSAQVSAPTGSYVIGSVNTDFTSGQFPPLTFTIPPSGQVYIAVSGDIQNTVSTTSTATLLFRISSGSATLSGPTYTLSVSAARSYATRRSLWSGTPGTSVTLTPQYAVSSDGGSGVTDVIHGTLMVEPVL